MKEPGRKPTDPFPTIYGDATKRARARASLITGPPKAPRQTAVVATAAAAAASSAGTAGRTYGIDTAHPVISARIRGSVVHKWHVRRQNAEAATVVAATGGGSTDEEIKSEGGGASGPTYKESEDALQEHEGGCTKGGGGSRPTTEGLKDKLSKREAGSGYCGAKGGDGGHAGHFKDDVTRQELRIGGESSRDELKDDVNQEDGGKVVEGCREVGTSRWRRRLDG